MEYLRKEIVSSIRAELREMLRDSLSRALTPAAAAQFNQPSSTTPTPTPTPAYPMTPTTGTAPPTVINYQHHASASASSSSPNHQSNKQKQSSSSISGSGHHLASPSHNTTLRTPVISESLVSSQGYSQTSLTVPKISCIQSYDSHEEINRVIPAPPLSQSSWGTCASRRGSSNSMHLAPLAENERQGSQKYTEI